LECFQPGFYSDGETVYVDMGEFLDTYGVCDVPEIRAVLWSDIKEIFSGVPVQELRAKTSICRQGERLRSLRGPQSMRPCFNHFHGAGG
jgi:hypothetical protein